MTHHRVFIWFARKHFSPPMILESAELHKMMEFRFTDYQTVVFFYVCISDITLYSVLKILTKNFCTKILAGIMDV
jgi:hypothetical protein